MHAGRAWASAPRPPRGDAGDPEPRERPFRQERAELPEGAAAYRGERIRVDVAAGERHVGVRERVHIHTALGEYPPQLLVVALRLGLLVGFLGVAPEDAAAPPPGLEAAALHALPVVELRAPVEEHDAEGGLEGRTGAQRPLDAVECRDGGRRVRMPLPHIELEVPGHDMQREDVVRILPPAADGVALHDPRALLQGKCQEVGVLVAGPVDARPAAVPLPH